VPRLDEPPVDVLYASTMPRARETAEALAPVLEMEPVLDPDLVELRPGDADGLPWDDVVARLGVRDLDRDPFEPFAPGGESRAAFSHRVLTGLYALVRRHEGSSILVACHGGVVDVAMRHVFGLGLTARLDLWTRNCSVTELVHAGREGEPRRWRLVRYNDSAHLAGLPASTVR
jgi:probable phosphoglycerate mutase